MIVFCKGDDISLLMQTLELLGVANTCVDLDRATHVIECSKHDLTHRAPAAINEICRQLDINPSAELRKAALDHLRNPQPATRIIMQYDPVTRRSVQKRIPI